MYTQEPKEQQPTFIFDTMIAPLLDHNNALFKITKAIDWVSLSEKLSKFYCSDNGRPSKPSRLKVGLLILKHLYKLSDIDACDTLKENLYAQYLCNVSLEKGKQFIEPSSLTRFRKQIGIEGIKLIEQEVLNSLQRAKLLKGRKLVTDTTVVSSNIAYPTDVSLLEKIRRKAVRYLDKAKQFGIKTYRTYKRAAQKVYITYQKIRQHTTKSRRRTQKKLLQFSQRNIKQLKEASQTITNSVGSCLDKTREQFLKESKKFLETASKIINQQKDVYKGLSVKERIVSIHKPHLRPIVRGKYPVEVEFGPKALLNFKNKFLFLEDLRFNNVSDTQLLDTAIKGYQERFEHLPSQLTTDRGFWSKENLNLALDYGISKIAIENKGKSSYLKDKPFRERLRRLRCSIEAKISLAKRKYGLDRSLYNIANGEEIWIRLGLMAMNLKTACSEQSRTAVGYG